MLAVAVAGLYQPLTHWQDCEPFAQEVPGIELHNLNSLSFRAIVIASDSAGLMW